jgi:hypothetical protein
LGRRRGVEQLEQLRYSRWSTAVDNLGIEKRKRGDFDRV